MEYSTQVATVVGYVALAFAVLFALAVFVAWIVFRFEQRDYAPSMTFGGDELTPEAQEAFDLQAARMAHYAETGELL